MVVDDSCIKESDKRMKKKGQRLREEKNHFQYELFSYICNINCKYI